MNGSTGRWVGIDVSKGKLDLAVLDERDKIKSHVFANDGKGHAAVMTWRTFQRPLRALCAAAHVER
jgi:hypothetical protein